MIKLLCVTRAFFPPRTGGSQAVFNAFKLLQNEVELHLFVLDWTIAGYADEIRKQLPKAKLHFAQPLRKDPYACVETIIRRISNPIRSITKTSKLKRYRDIGPGLDLPINQPKLKELNDYVARHAIDVVQFEFMDCAFLSLGLVDENVKKVFVHHELQYVVELTRLGTPVSEDEWLRYMINKNREIGILNCYDGIITLSKEDKDRLQSAGVVVPIYPSFAKTSSGASAFDSEIIRKDLFFLGPESHIPNKKGLTWFVENVWGLISAKKTDVRLHIIGHWDNGTAELWQSKFKNVIFHGFVEKLDELISDKIMIVPIREGSGIRMKILEAAKGFIPVVSCAVGAEGLGLTSGTNCYITDDEVTFAGYVIDLLEHPEKANAMGVNAHNYFDEAFSDEAFVKSRMDCYNSLLNI